MLLILCGERELEPQQRDVHVHRRGEPGGLVLGLDGRPNQVRRRGFVVIMRAQTAGMRMLHAGREGGRYQQGHRDQPRTTF